jgi:hypothetical protein
MKARSDPDMTRGPVRGVVILPAAAIACLLAPLAPSAVEAVYSRLVYRGSQEVVTPLTNLAPFAVLDLLIGIAGALVLWRAVRLVGFARREGARAALWQGARRLLRAGAVVVLVFFWLWGFNYRRPSIESALPGGAAAQPASEAIDEAFTLSAQLAAGLRPAAIAESSAGLADVARRLHAPMNEALALLQREPLGQPGRPKHSILLQPFLARAGVDGMINPLGLESILERSLLPIEQPFVLAHEWAHLAGHADEAEASAVGWLACLHGSQLAAYSASLYLIRETHAALPRAARRDAYARLDPGVREDLGRIADRMLAARNPVVERAAFRVYDEYLKANRVEDGTASYGRALTLILSEPLRGRLREYE